MRVEAQILQRLARAGDETAERAEGFREGAVGEGNAILDAELLRRAAPVFAAGENGMRLVDEDTRAVCFGDIDQCLQVSEVAVHRINALDHDQLAFPGVPA